jgi:hypothetical protein
VPYEILISIYQLTSRLGPIRSILKSEAVLFFVPIGEVQSIKLREPLFVKDKDSCATIDAMPTKKDDVRKRQGKKTY